MDETDNYSFEYHDDDAIAFVTFDNGKQVSVTFLDNTIVVEPLDGATLGVDELPGKLCIDVG